MFKCFLGDAQNKLYFKFNVSLSGFYFVFALYNIEFNISIPFPVCFNGFHELFWCNILSPFCRKYKNVDSIHKRWWEFQAFFVSDLETGFEIKISNLQDHGDRIIALSLLGLEGVFNSYHSWHLCRSEDGNWRFPTDEELVEYDTYCKKLVNEIFEDGKMPDEFNSSKKEQKLLDKYYKKISEYYNNIPLNDKQKEFH